MRPAGERWKDVIELYGDQLPELLRSAGFLHAEELAELLAKGLQGAGYEADVLSTIAEAASVLGSTFYTALILDLGLPDGDGLSLLREIRDRGNPIPVLVLTARGGLTDRVSGLRGGADDYLVKPFALEELIARLEAQLRRPGHLLGTSLRIAHAAVAPRCRRRPRGPARPASGGRE